MGNPNQQELVVSGAIQRIDLQVKDDSGLAVNATELVLTVYNASGEVIIKDDYVNNLYGVDAPAAPTHIVHPTTGSYYFPFGDTSFDAANTTETPGEYLFMWRGVGISGTEQFTVVQVVKVITVRTMLWVPKLRFIVDKAGKTIDEDPDDPLYLGYTDSMIVQCLEDGLSWINAFQPYPMWNTLDSFPSAHWAILKDAALFSALQSQEIFAIDTDLNYGDQGNTFMIDHQPKLAAVLNATWTRMTTSVPAMKRHYLNNGSVRVEMGPNFRFQALLNAAPQGSLFRSWFVGGGL